MYNVMNDVYIKNGIVIPEHEITFTFSRAGGPGGQHVNRTETRVTLYWNVKKTTALSEEQKERVIRNLQRQLADDDVLIIHNSESRSQLQNKQAALMTLAQMVRKALHVAKKRMKTSVPQKAKEERLHSKTLRSSLKKMRSKKIKYD